jgi:hypothetical protein
VRTTRRLRLTGTSHASSRTDAHHLSPASADAARERGICSKSKPLRWPAGASRDHQVAVRSSERQAGSRWNLGGEQSPWKDRTCELRKRSWHVTDSSVEKRLEGDDDRAFTHGDWLQFAACRTRLRVRVSSRSPRGQRALWLGSPSHSRHAGGVWVLHARFVGRKLGHLRMPGSRDACSRERHAARCGRAGPRLWRHSGGAVHDTSVSGMRDCPLRRGGDSRQRGTSRDRVEDPEHFGVQALALR